MSQGLVILTNFVFTNEMNGSKIPLKKSDRQGTSLVYGTEQSRSHLII